MKKTLNRMESSTLLRFLALWFAFLSQKIRSSNTHYSHIFTNLSKTAFCKDLDFFEQQRYYPVDVPEHHLPHIWDAVYDPILHMVELTTINRSPCKFNKRRWKELVDLFPNHTHQLAFGLSSNILITVEENYTVFQEEYLLGKRVTCEYFHGNNINNKVYTTMSYRIDGISPFSSTGTLQIRCPTPNKQSISSHISWDSIRLNINCDRQEYISNIFSNYTAIVPVCHLPTYEPSSKQYKLSVCTATARANRSHLVEWIEYHRLVGVSHFFIYDTTVNENRNRLQVVLHDYILEGIVSIIPWHFMNCVRNMANGRWNAYYIKNKIDPIYFEPPKAIAQYTALASCYSRFKHTSTYMTHIDDDEFLSFSPYRVIEYVKERFDITTKYPTNLVELSDMLFSFYPKLTSIRFEPVMFWPCNITTGVEHVPYNAIHYPVGKIPRNNITETPLPRIGVWDLSEPFKRSHECKMIMRTDMVGMYFIHYISMIEPGPWKSSRQRDKPSLTLPLTHLSLLHYKYPASLVKNVLEGVIPFRPDGFQRDCRYVRKRNFYHSHYYAQISYSIAQTLKKNFIYRMESIQ